ncbi:MAG: DNA repair protein RecN [Thermodesulfovibrionia bacterium]|nr:DNA repair protein RecN [Thermodesulfovibrionia bacterium]
MLRELRIKNLAIIEDAAAEFGPGLNVLTGETGAGKSIIISALSLALGERATSTIIRSGEKEGTVQAFFDIKPGAFNKSVETFLRDSGVEADEGIILTRNISSTGKSKAYINDSMINLQTLSDASSALIDIHGQFEHQSLLAAEKQLELLDLHGGLHKERQEVSDLYERMSGLRQKISALTQKDKERLQRIDMLQFQIKEIESAGVKVGEEEELEEETKILSSAVRLAELANRAYDSLYSLDSASITNLSSVINDLKEISVIDSRAAEALKSAEEAMPLLEEASYFLRDYKDGINFDPARLEEVQERLELIKRLKKKYGETLQDVIDKRESALIELEELQHSEEMLDSLKKELDDSRNRLTEKAHELSKKRKSVAKKLEPKIIEELSKLSMPDTQFSISIAQQQGDDTADGFKVTSMGIDDIEFLISPNVGETLKPLSKIASGGELSRVMLALKGIMSDGDNIPVLVFDEIDAGIGGKAAETVGKRLKDLSSMHQVICITHLPQIASYADIHLKIEKKTEKGKTRVRINRVEKDARVEEIARMLSGEISDVSLKHAKEMLKAKQN